VSVLKRKDSFSDDEMMNLWLSETKQERTKENQDMIDDNARWLTSKKNRWRHAEKNNIKKTLDARYV